ncbi:non-homologous end-joining DNA ligase [Ilumatobacter sp.]|uniref:non-homologous end-joining DNA ligase n=1 Tax=Ilumatobacter sp. TaxID=1967498 RepID=UPI003C6FD220
MKATLGSLPAHDDGWAYEIKWDGHRTLAHIDAERTRLQTTSGRDSSERWPEVTAIGRGLNASTAILDGEMLVIGEDGRPSFDLVQRRDPSVHAAVFHVFDVLSIDGTDTVDLAYLDRRRLLEQVLEAGDHWAIPPHHVGGGADLLAATAAQQLEGLIAKRVDSTYRVGTRTKDWLKIKNRNRVDVVIGGFSTGAGNRSGTFGSLLVGVHNDTRLRFAGGVGTGFTQATLERLTALMRPLTTTTCPFDPEPPSAVKRTATWLRPELTATIEIAEFTNDGHVRHASFVELKDDR